MTKELFGYICQECGKGTMVTTVFPEYKTKFEGHPFVVKDAIIGVCDKCGAMDFDHTEMARWEQEFESLHAQDYLSAKAIRNLRARLGLSADDFAHLIGATRQSVHHWEALSRRTHQSIISDSLLRLLSESIEKHEIDVLDFLVARAGVFGHDLAGKISKARRQPPLSLSVEEMSPAQVQAQASDGATGDDQAGMVGETRASYSPRGAAHLLYDDATGQDFGALTFDEQAAAVKMVLWSGLSGVFTVEVRLGDAWQPAKKVEIKDGKATLLRGAKRAQLGEVKGVKLSRVD